MIFIIRSGVQILSDHPRLYWTRHSTPGKDWFRIQKPVPADPLWTAKQDSISLPGQVGLPGHPPLDRAGPLVAPRRRHAVAAQRRRLLRPALRHRAVAAPGAHQLGRHPELGVGADPVPVAGLADRERLGGLQQPAADRLLHHRLRRRPAGAHHGARHVAGAVDPVQAGSARLFSIQTARSLHFLVLVWFLLFIVMHVDAGVHDRAAAQPQPHLRRPRRRRTGSVSGSSPRRWWSSSSAGWRPPRSPSATRGSCSASATR